MLFQERQVFIRRWWPLLLAPAIVIATLWWLLPANPNQAGWSAAVAGVIVVLSIGLLLTLRLETRLDAAGVHYRLFPLQLTWRSRPWTELAAAYVRSYDPLGEYGGWGLKGSQSNRALNISGDQGLQLELRDGSRLLLGTQRPAEITQVLEQLGVPGPSTVPTN
ncbi:hypothetical protein [Hymenobacter properus]|uniref:Uncharacterized protein n=1 Tax=Hymenobacter properus TaxID=2791026 RepID=A0A931FIE7_9BACT|nr:hypothetical protein [Hymenobacter properus]MBF9141972.1 hypothetical protein [Hymenobacter properus]MBR7720779.1 hypothetical protein [Microvirga sp. SRT04]